ncbi:MAG: bifunctional phosphoribosylaminoimidazolecarboxamide formyltransferase/IMP cyclohydrolase [Ardenticatenales bacterium]|nr:bifunctional phosphoribosylaminoimidazolecarboxamide formyltransferase/IMP cyclohydrolase [Ardenticatenales bacterium]
MIQRALLSVSDKTGLIELARGLAELGIELISTGGTARALKEAGIPVTPIELVTSTPEMLGGRVKTLHPMVHAGLLARRHVAADEADLAKQGIAKIDLIAVNLYPFEESIAQPDITLSDAIEQIDIGGVALLRAGAKNYIDVTVLSDPADYEAVLRQLREGGEVNDTTRAALAVKAFQSTARYDAAISGYLSEMLGEGESALFPNRLTLGATKAEEMRYGENPHQRAALYQVPDVGGLGNAEQLHGKEMSYTNWLDAEGAWGAVQMFHTPAIVIVKHASPCGIATNNSLVQAWQDALASDPVSAFGGVVAVNRPVDLATAQAIDTIFTEIILAPAFEQEALTLLEEKKNRRLLRVPLYTGSPVEVRSIPGGFIAQEQDEPEEEIKMEVVSRRAPSQDEQGTLAFAWRAAIAVKSNAIVLARAVEGGFTTVGIGSGQPNRVDSVGLAVQKAGEKARGAVLASDAFFPFPDGVERAVAAGVSAIIQPGGSIRDDAVIEAADAHEAAMVLTGVRHFRH